jgi:hypothetical protein
MADGEAMSDSLAPRDHAEAVALFRAEIIGALARSELDRGELAAMIRKLAERKYRSPGRRASAPRPEAGVSRCSGSHSTYSAEAPRVTRCRASAIGTKSVSARSTSAARWVAASSAERTACSTSAGQGRARSWTEATRCGAKHHPSKALEAS